MTATARTVVLPVVERSQTGTTHAAPNKVRTLLWRELCQCLFEHRPVTLLPRPYNGRPATPSNQ